VIGSGHLATLKQAKSDPVACSTHIDARKHHWETVQYHTGGRLGHTRRLERREPSRKRAPRGRIGFGDPKVPPLLPPIADESMPFCVSTFVLGA
jgi:hypothetical protein